MRRARRIALFAVVALLQAELIYLVYANLRVHQAIAALGIGTHTRIDYESAFSWYPGYVQVRNLQLRPDALPYVSVELEQAELRLYPANWLLQWAATLEFPTQLVRATVDTELLIGTASGTLNFDDVRMAAESARVVDGRLRFVRGAPDAPRQEPSGLTAALEVDGGEISSLSGYDLRGDLVLTGANAWRLGQRFGLRQLLAAVPSVRELPWSLRAELRAEPMRISARAITFQSGDVGARGSYVLAPYERGGAFLVNAGGRRVGLSLRGGVIELTENAEDGWLERELKSLQVTDLGARALSRVPKAHDR